MLDAAEEKSNIDVGYFGVKGFVVDLETGAHVEYPDMEVTDEASNCSVM